MRHKRAFAWLLRLTAVVILLLAIGMIVLPEILGPDVVGRNLRLTAWTGFLLCLGAVAALLALASLLQRETQVPQEIHDSMNRLQAQLMDLQVKLGDLHLMSDRASRAAPAIQQTVPPPETYTRDYSDEFRQLFEAIEQVREIALLPDADRKQRVVAHRQQRKTGLVNELFALVAAHEWSRAERMIVTLETEYPNDSDVAKGRSYLDHSRKLFEEETVNREIRQIDDLMATGSWEKAYQRAQTLVQGFPTSTDSHAVLARVERERNVYREANVQRMFEEIRHDIERRMWRRALSHAERLLEGHSEHRLAQRIAEQLPTLRDNAEIEERQELEVRIQELIRSGEFDHAIELAEDVIRRFPNSPQAESLDTLLPRIRDLARQQSEQMQQANPDAFAGLTRSTNNGGNATPPRPLPQPQPETVEHSRAGE